jgi:cystathionine beta-lyase/cystathionine gamma-synthase
MIYAETPCNPLMTLIDIEALGRLGRERGVLTCVDGTFASPLAQQPLRLGVDFSVHSW